MTDVNLVYSAWSNNPCLIRIDLLKFLTLHYGNFFFLQAVEGVNEAVDFDFKGLDVSLGISFLGGQDLGDDGNKLVMLMSGFKVS